METKINTNKNSYFSPFIHGCVDTNNRKMNLKNLKPTG